MTQPDESGDPERPERPERPGRESRDGERDEQGQAGVDVWLVPFFTDSTLWPVLLVAVAAAVSVGVALVTLAWSDRNPFGVVGILAVAWMSFDMVKRERQAAGSGWIARLVFAVWFLIAVSCGSLIALGWI